MQYILQKGVRAPSGDNMQPWKFKVKKNTISILVDYEVDKSTFNPNYLMSFIALGAVAENMKLAATTFGLASRLTYSKKGVTIALKKSSKIKKDELVDYIDERIVNRKFYKKIPDETIFKKLESSAYYGSRVLFLRDSQLNRFAVVAAKTAHFFLSLPGILDMLLDRIWFTDKKAKEKGYGFALKNLELNIIEKSLLFSCQLPLLRKFFLLGGNGLFLLGYSVKDFLLIKSAGRACCITVPHETPEWFMKGGQDMQRVFLTCAKEKVSLQPHGAVYYLALYSKYNEDKLSLKRKERINTLYTEFCETFGIRNQCPIMTFRFGFSKPPSLPTFRKPVTSFLLRR